jgi:UDP:flavonoid glycosyltransferase YjiC (YdhE family)
MLNTSGGMNLGESGSNPIRFIRSMQQVFTSAVQDYIDAFSADLLFDSDLIINQIPSSFFGYELAEKLRIPHISAAVMPLATTSAWPLCLLPSFSLGGWYNRLTYQTADQIGWRMMRAPINRFRQKIGLPPAPFVGHYRRMQTERVPVLNGFSTHVVPRPADWGDHIHVSGYWILDEPDWTPPPDLTAFLDSGTPPIFFGFGSMPIRDTARLTAIILDALAKSGQRGILSSGWAGLAGDDLPDNVMQIGYTPYAWLFPRMAAVIHHGGSGTTGLALRSGVPSMIVPFLADQFYWGKRITELGVSPGSIPHKKLAADALARSIQAMVRDESMRMRAAALGEKLRLENGIQNALQIIHQIINQ